MTGIQFVLVAVLGVCMLVGVVSFRAGDRARRATSGPRPLGSIGEALRQANSRGPSAVVLVFFLRSGQERLLDGVGLSKLLEQPERLAVVLEERKAGAEVLNHLFEKYTQESPPRNSRCLMLNGEGQSLAMAKLSQHPDPDSFATWVAKHAPTLPGRETT